MGDLFELASGVMPDYSATSSDDDVLAATGRQTMLTLTPGPDPAGGSATITVKAFADGASAEVMYMATVDALPQVLTITSVPMSGSAVEEGSTITVTATNNQPTLAAMTVELDVSGPASGATQIMLAAGDMSGSAALTVASDDVVMAMPAIVIVASNPAIAGGSHVLNFTVNEDDVETTYSVAPAAVSVTEGGEGMMITATASQAAMANTEVMLMHGAGNASEDDYSLDPVLITIMEGDTSGSTTLTATDDYDVEGMEMVTLNAMIGTMSVGTVEVTIVDDDMETMYELSSSADMVDEGGEAVTITATVTQGMVREDTMVELTMVGGSADADDYSLDPMMITIAAGETSGSAMLTATDDVHVEGVETLRLQGAIGSMIIGQVLLEIGDNDMEIAYTLSGPMDMNLVEGMEYELTAAAEPAVQVDTEVAIMRDRSMSDADEGDYSVESIMIMAGEGSGTTMLMVTEDTMEDSGHGSPEMLVLYGEVDGMPTNSLSFYLWDAAVPALPVIAQLLLAAFLAIGGYRRYRRR